ncbi:Npt1/Npt2 family nucleotide transporter [Aquimarina sp. U1-2]|uniref:Npt1/Npt2 family nucleotide transporter n=1 Tax=Aquimarina sp. U1-2 TaxID=2823141 RepID=UPI001FEEA40B|nr:Npt1/Npt2 family nucleotide transporter [Aquimarina sp. U1-2]
MQFYIFLIITALLLIKPTVNAIFLSELGGDQLPNAYILVAFAAILSSYFYNKTIHRFSIKIINTLSLSLFSFLFLLLGFLMNTPSISSGFLLYFYYVAVSLFAVLTTSQFWILANMVYNAREAKRLFGFIGAGAIMGGVFGGYLTSIIASRLGNTYVVLLAGSLIFCCIPLLVLIWKTKIQKLNSYAKKQRQRNDIKSYSSSVKLIIQSKHLTYLALITGIGVFIAKLVDFQFSDLANRVIQDADRLASFFGFWFSTFSVIALCIQLFLTNRVVTFLGVSSSLLVLPLGIALGSLLFLMVPELWVMVLIKGVDGSVKQSLNKASIELAIMPIPHRIKKQAKSYIDVVVDSLATGLAGVLLIFVIRKLDLPSSYITTITILFLFVWILLIYRLRGEYFNSFRLNIQNSLNHNKEKKKDDKSTLRLVTTTLNKGTESEIINVLTNLTHGAIKPFKESIVHLLDHPSHQIKRLAIQHLYVFDKGTAADEIEKLIFSKNDETVYAAMDYLLEHTAIDTEDIFTSFLDHDDDYIANAALLCLAKESGSNHRLAKKYELEARIKNNIQELIMPSNEHRIEEIAEMLITIAYAGMSQYYSYISVYFNHTNPYIVNHAIKAAGITSEDMFVERLFYFLTEKLYRKKAISALKNYGQEINETILKQDKNEILSTSVQRHLPKVVTAFKTQNSVSVLLRLVKSNDVLIRLEAAKGLNKLQRKTKRLAIPQKKVMALILKEIKTYTYTIHTIQCLEQSTTTFSKTNITYSDLVQEHQIALEHLLLILEAHKKKSFSCIFKLLSLKYTHADIEMAYVGWSSEIQEIKANALEFLDNLLEMKLKSALLPLMEDQIRATSVLEKHVFTTAHQCLLHLLKHRGEQIKLAVLNVLRYASNTKSIPHIKPLLKHKSAEVRLFAQRAIETITVESMAQSLD